jgi:predicted nucleic acid-binding Zn ribbon protein
VVRLAQVTPHRHCIVCGKTIDEDETFCDELCEAKYKSAQKRQMLFFAIFIVLLVLIIILPMLIGTPTS